MTVIADFTGYDENSRPTRNEEIQGEVRRQLFEKDIDD